MITIKEAEELLNSIRYSCLPRYEKNAFLKDWQDAGLVEKPEKDKTMELAVVKYFKENKKGE
jgi:hypothetical protein